MIKYGFIFSAILLLLVGCGSNKEIAGDEAFTRITPLKELEKDIPTQQPINLTVIARNIADLSHSNKNRFELLINDRKVQPSTEVTNATNTYTYRLRLQPGYYRLKGYYLWHNGRREERTEVEMNEPLRIIDNQKAEVTTTIRKDWRGTPVTDKFLFDVTYKPLFEEEQAGVAENTAVRGDNTNKIKIQVNADPQNSLVILDDLVAGNAPISLWVDRNTSHVIQVSHTGYQSIFRYLDEEKLQGEEKLILIEQLTPLTALNFFGQPNPAAQSEGSGQPAATSAGGGTGGPAPTAENNPESAEETPNATTPPAGTINAQPQPPNNFEQPSVSSAGDNGQAAPEEGDVPQEQTSTEEAGSVSQSAQPAEGEGGQPQQQDSNEQKNDTADQQLSSANEDGQAPSSESANQPDDKQSADKPEADQSQKPASQSQSQPPEVSETAQEE